MPDISKSRDDIQRLNVDIGGGNFAEVVSVIGGASGSVTAPGVAGTAAQAVQGIPNGVLIPVDTLASLGTPRLIAFGAANVNLILTTTARRISIHATTAAFYAVGTGAQTASATSHFIGVGERLDFDLPANAQIAAIQSTAAGTLYITELV